jgi:hypothetical protein
VAELQHIRYSSVAPLHHSSYPENAETAVGSQQRACRDVCAQETPKLTTTMRTLQASSKSSEFLVAAQLFANKLIINKI